MKAAASVRFKDSQERSRQYINDKGSCDFPQIVDAEPSELGIALNHSVLAVAITKDAHAHMGVDVIRSVKTIVVLAGLLAATTAYAGVREYIESFHHAYLVMSDGTRMSADIVKVHGRMMVMIPVEDLPDYLHQQVIKVMNHR